MLRSRRLFHGFFSADPQDHRVRAVAAPGGHDGRLRHAGAAGGAIYLKNLISQSWQDREVEGGQQLPFAIHEQDRALIRDSIVDAVVHAPDLIRTQLCTCVNNMVKHDFPGRWTQIVDKVSSAGWKRGV